MRVYGILAIAACLCACKTAQHNTGAPAHLTSAEQPQMEEYFSQGLEIEAPDLVEGDDSLKPVPRKQMEANLTGSESNAQKMGQAWREFVSIINSAGEGLAKVEAQEKKYWHTIVDNLSGARFDHIVYPDAGKDLSGCVGDRIDAFTMYGGRRRVVGVCARALTNEPQYIAQALVHEFIHKLLWKDECKTTRAEIGVMLLAGKDYFRNGYVGRCQIDRWLDGKVTLGAGFLYTIEPDILACEFANRETEDIANVSFETATVAEASSQEDRFFDTASEMTVRYTVAYDFWPDPTRSFSVSLKDFYASSEVLEAIKNRDLGADYLEKFLPYISEKYETDKSWEIERCYQRADHSD